MPPLNLLYSARLAGLQRTELLGEVRNIAALRTVLQDATLTHCLHLKPARGAPLVLATLYAFRDAADARDTEKQAPLFRKLVVGAARPSEVRIDTAAGWLAFTNDGHTWRAVPWSVPALRALARPVFVAKPGGTSSWARTGLMRLIVGDEGPRRRNAVGAAARST